jgi:hypothetical protein
VALAGLAGCSGRAGEATVSGKVTLPGDKPLPGGRLHLHPTANGSPAVVTVNPDGTFSSSGVPVGDYKVTVESVGVLNPMAMTGGVQPPPDIAAKMKEQAASLPGSKGGTFVEIPFTFTDANSTPLTWTIHEGKNEAKEFRLE